LLDHVKWPSSQGGSIRLQELIESEKSLMAMDNLLLVDLPDGNLTTLKSPPKQHGTSQGNMKVDSSSKRQNT